MPFKSQVTSDAQSKNRAKKKKISKLSENCFYNSPCFFTLITGWRRNGKILQKRELTFKKKKYQYYFLKKKKVLGQQGLRSSHSADTRRHSNSPPYYPGSDGNLSTCSSTGSLKRRRSVRNKNEITFDAKQDQWIKNEEGIDSTQKKLKGLNLTLYQNKSKNKLPPNLLLTNN